jgi:hypothetical protein
MKRVAVMLRFEMINGSIKFFKDGKYRQQKDKKRTKEKYRYKLGYWNRL